MSSQLILSQFNNAEVVVDIHVGVSVLRGTLGIYYKDDKNFNLWVVKKYGNWMKLFFFFNLHQVSSKEFLNLLPLANP